MKDSSSWHTLNADRGLPGWRKLAYLKLNAVRNLWPGPHPAMTRFAPGDVQRRQWDGMEMDRNASMARKWSNLFWSRFPWRSLAGRLGPLNMVDVGCGRGGYGSRFVAWADDALASYRGMDPMDRADAWREVTAREPRCTFVRAGAEDIGRVLDEDTNLIISQSALEHIPGDVRLLRDIAAWAANIPNPVVQIHLVPAAAALPLYWFHGIRQYPLRSIRMLARACPGWDAQVYGLGGRTSWALQWSTSGLPMLLRRPQRPGPDYERRSWQAFQADAGDPRGPALFYALILSRGPDSGIIPRL